MIDGVTEITYSLIFTACEINIEKEIMANQVNAGDETRVFESDLLFST